MPRPGDAPLAHGTCPRLVLSFLVLFLPLLLRLHLLPPLFSSSRFFRGQWGFSFRATELNRRSFFINFNSTSGARRGATRGGVEVEAPLLFVRVLAAGEDVHYELVLVVAIQPRFCALWSERAPTELLLVNVIRCRPDVPSRSSLQECPLTIFHSSRSSSRHWPPRRRQSEISEIILRGRYLSPFSFSIAAAAATVYTRFIGALRSSVTARSHVTDASI